MRLSITRLQMPGMPGLVGLPRLLGLAALALSLIGLALDARLFFAAWLAAWWFCLGLMFGGVASVWMHRLSGGRWGELLALPARALLRPLPWLLLLFLPLLAGLHTLYPWAGARAAWLAAMDQPRFAAAWFAPWSFGVRLLLYALLWGWLARPRRVQSAAGAALALLVYMLLASLCAFDLLMALVPGWTSTVFGWLATLGQMTAGAAAAVVLAAWPTRNGAASNTASNGAPQPPVWRDLGNLLLMFVMMQAYLQFVQFLIIWAENLPREIVWFVPRLQTGWRGVGVALMLLQFALPFTALLWRSVKDRPHRLALVAGWIVLMQGVDAAWLVVPSVQAHGWQAWWVLPLVFAGMTLLVFGRVGAALAAARGAGDD